MDIMTVLEAAHSPLSLEELKEYSGNMFSKDRLDSLVRSGDVKKVPGMDEVYWLVPPHLKKSGNYKKFTSPMKTIDRGSLYHDISSLRENLNSIISECDSLHSREDEFVTKEQQDLHIQRLHYYNEMKDIANLVCEQLSNIKGVGTAKIYEEYDIDISD